MSKISLNTPLQAQLEVPPSALLVLCLGSFYQPSSCPALLDPFGSFVPASASSASSLVWPSYDLAHPNNSSRLNEFSLLCLQCSLWLSQPTTSRLFSPFQLCPYVQRSFGCPCCNQLVFLKPFFFQTFSCPIRLPQLIRFSRQASPRLSPSCSASQGAKCWYQMSSPSIL